MTTNGAVGVADETIHLGSAAQFAAVRALFQRVSYDEATILPRLGIKEIFGYPRISDGRRTLTGPVEDATAALVRLFLDGEAVDAALAQTLLGEDACAALEALGLVRREADGANRLRPTVFVVPVEGLWLASDLIAGKRVDAATDRRDLVFPPASGLTGDYLATIPEAPGARVLELCTGAGVTALRALRRGAREAWASDLVPRSVHFTRFNAALNDLSVTVVESDVYDGLGDETFDRIYAHPPYVPALAHEFDYRDAGADGEQVTQRIVEGLAAHLRPRGRASLTCAMTDRDGKSVQDRLRGWLGAASPEFDVVVFQHRSWDLKHAYRRATGGGADYADCERWMRHFAALGIQQFALVSIELRREARGRHPITERRMGGAAVDAPAIDWAFTVARRLNDETVARVLPTLRPRVVPDLTAKIVLRSDVARDWHVAGAAVESEYPVAAALMLPPLAPTLLELCDGTRDTPALWKALGAAGLLTADVTPTDIARVVQMLLALGAVEVDGVPVPRHPVTRRRA